MSTGLERIGQQRSTLFFKSNADGRFVKKIIQAEAEASVWPVIREVRGQGGEGKEFRSGRCLYEPKLSKKKVRGEK